MNNLEDEYNDGIIIDTICAGCDLFKPVNDLSLCDDCFAMLERDLIRSQDWERSATAFMIAKENLEALRDQIILEYGADYELIEDPTTNELKRKNKGAHSSNTQHKRVIAAKAARDYTTEDVLQSARDFLQSHGANWVNFSYLSQHLCETFFKIKPKQLGQPEKKYKSLVKFIADYPDDFEVRQDDEIRGVYWVRLSQAKE